MKQYAITHYTEAFNAYAEKYGTDAARAKFYDLIYEAIATPINACQAWVLTDREGNKYLQSYNTIVSVKFAGDHIQELGKWSRTTSKHQGYFYRYV
jgi:hypothetical protein